MLGIGLGITDVATIGGQFKPSAVAMLAGATALPSWLSHSRAGNAMMFDSTGNLTYAPNNLALSSEDFTSASWQKDQSGTGVLPVVTANYAAAPDGTMTADRIQFDHGGGAGAFSRIQQGCVVGQIGINTIWSVWLKTTDGSTKTLGVRLVGAILNATVTGDWQQFYIKTPSVASATSAQLILWQTQGHQQTADILAAWAQDEAVTYETTPRDYNKTTSAAYYSPRFDYDTRAPIPGSLYLEPVARTHRALHNRDLTNAAWVKTTMTAAKTSTGIDGVANSCSRLTATAANAMALQTVTIAAASRSFAPYIKRITGTGTIEITQDGVTWTDVTASVNSSSFTLVPTLVASILNPVFGIRLGTNGDAIDVDFVDLEDGSYKTSPIPVTTAAVTRAADVVSIADGPLTTLQSGKWTVAIEHKTITPVSFNPIFLGIGANTYPLGTYDDTLIQAYDPAGAPASVVSGAGPAGSWTSTGSRAIASSNSERRAAIKGGASVGSGGPFVTAVSTPKLGSSNTGAFESCGWYSSIAFWNTDLPAATMQQKANLALGSGW